MRILVTEKQYKLLLGNIESSEIDEQSDDPAAAQPTAGTSSSGSKQGYPEVGIWKPKITRGPDNQIEVGTWSNNVGSKITRGPDNQLK